MQGIRAGGGGGGWVGGLVFKYGRSLNSKRDWFASLCEMHDR